jgi:subtilisin-like proprotein convertase family protein
MRSCFIALAVVALLVSGTAYANSPISKDVVLPDPGSPADGPGCSTTDYKSYTVTSGASIPDNTAAGILSGPLTITDAEGVLDLVVDVGISHTWMGDLTVNLYYDRACNGPADDVPISLLCRQDLAGCPGPGSCCGCSDDLLVSSTYTFSASGSAPMSEPCSFSGSVASGCYREAVESASHLGDVSTKEGCWYLQVSDGAGLDTGFLSDWTLYFLNETGTATEAATWGSVKTLYHE